MRIRSMAQLQGVAILLLGMAALTAAAQAQPPGVDTGSFAVAQHGHNVGTASYRLTATRTGYASTSVVQVALQGLDYALSKTEQLAPSSELKHALVSAVVNGEAVNVVAAPDATQFLLNISANGRSSTARLAAHSGAVLLPDFDPGALETLLRLAAERDNRNLWAILPKNSGSIAAVQLATYPDLQGTLNGKAIVVHHLQATIANAQTDLFTSPRNHLLQAELPQEGFALVRQGFVLKPPSKPIAPPPSATGQPDSAQ